MAIVDARAKQGATGVKQIVGLVWYNLPDHDCSGGEASGEFDSTKGGMERYQREFGQPLTDKLSAASDLEFVIVLESDAVGNIVTNQESVPFCARAAPVYEERIAYSISILKQANVHIYLDIAHEGWLSWPDNLPKTAETVARVVKASGEGNTLRSFVTNVSSYNAFVAEDGPGEGQSGNPSYDESHFVSFAKSSAMEATRALQLAFREI